MTDTLHRAAGDDPTSPPAADLSTTPSPAGGAVRLAVLAAVIVAIGLLAGWVWVGVVAAIVVSIFLHEMGHFLVARATGMKVSEFFISFGPRIWSFRRGETEYGLKTVPLGAYVRIVGMSNLEELDPADEPRTYRAKSYPKRLAVVLAGPFANFALGLAILTVLFMTAGTAGTAWTISAVVPGTAAEAAGFVVGDQVVRIGDTEVESWDDFGAAVRATGGQPAEAVVIRDGAEVVLPIQAGWRLSPEAAALVPPLTDDDVIRSVNGRPVTTYDDFRQAMAELPEGSADVAFMRARGEYRSPDVRVPVELPAAGSAPFLGLSPEVERVQLGPLAAAGEAVSTFGQIMAGAGEGLTRFVSPDGLSRYASLVTDPPQPTDDGTTVVGSQRIIAVDGGARAAVDPASDPANEVRPLSILGLGRLLGQAADSGWTSFLFLLAGFNLMVGLFNLLPLPPLDGGHALVATYEAVRGRIAHRQYRVDMARLLPVTYAVVGLLLVLGMTSIWLDAVSPVANPYGP